MMESYTHHSFFCTEEIRKVYFNPICKSISNSTQHFSIFIFFYMPFISVSGLASLTGAENASSRRLVELQQQQQHEAEAKMTSSTSSSMKRKSKKKEGKGTSSDPMTHPTSPKKSPKESISSMASTTVLLSSSSAMGQDHATPTPPSTEAVPFPTSSMAQLLQEAARKMAAPTTSEDMGGGGEAFRHPPGMGTAVTPLGRTHAMSSSSFLSTTSSPASLAAGAKTRGGNTISLRHDLLPAFTATPPAAAAAGPPRTGETSFPSAAAGSGKGRRARDRSSTAMAGRTMDATTTTAVGDISSTGYHPTTTPMDRLVCTSESRDITETSFKAENPVLPDDHYLYQPVETFVHKKLRRSLTEVLHIERLTRIQRLCWEGMCDMEADVVIRSETGSGKTLAYALPLLHQLLLHCDVDPVKRETCGTLMIVMCPTRELVLQVTDTLMALLRHAMFLTVGGISGGENRHKEKARLRKGISILIATPGRLLDHLQSTSSLVVVRLQSLVMDEADRLLDMGFEKAILQIMQLLQERRSGKSHGSGSHRLGSSSTTTIAADPTGLAHVKRVLVSATITDGVDRLSHFTLRPHILRFGETEDTFSIPPTLRQQYACVPTKHRLSALLSFLRSQMDAGAKKIVIFVSTADGTEFLYYLVSRLKDPFRKGGERGGGGSGTAGVLGSHHTSGGGRGDEIHPGQKGTTGSTKPSVRRLTALANQHLRNDLKDSEMDDEEEEGGASRTRRTMEQVITFDETESEEDEDGRGGGGGGSTLAGSVETATLVRGGRNVRELGTGFPYFLDVDVFKLHGNMSQVDRAAVFHSFRYGTDGEKKSTKHTSSSSSGPSGGGPHSDSSPSSPASSSSSTRCGLLFCTDVAARGLDMPDIHWIVHYDPPVSALSYVHRIGRTARIGRSGDSMLFLAPHEEGFAMYLSQFLSQKDFSKTSPSTTFTAVAPTAAGPSRSSSTSTTMATKHATCAGTSAPLPPSEMLLKKKPYETLLYYLTKLDGDPRNHTIYTSAATLERAIARLVMKDDCLGREGGWRKRSHWRGSQRDGGEGRREEDDNEEDGDVDGYASESERERENLCRLALFGYQSYLRAYAAIPKEIRYAFFDSRELHLGHVAQSFGLDKSPAEIQKQLRHGIQQDRALARDPKAMGGSSSSRGDGSGVWGGRREDGCMDGVNDMVEAESGATAGHGHGEGLVPLVGTRGHNKQKLIRVAVEHDDQYHSTIVLKQRKRTRDWLESKQREGERHRVKPLQFTEFDA